MGATNAKVYISLFSGKTKFVGESTQQYVKHLGSSVEVMFEEPETSNKVQHFLGNLFKNYVRSAEVKIEDLKDSNGKSLLDYRINWSPLISGLLWVKCSVKWRRTS